MEKARDALKWIQIPTSWGAMEKNTIGTYGFEILAQALFRLLVVMQTDVSLREPVYLSLSVPQMTIIS